MYIQCTVQAGSNYASIFVLIVGVLYIAFENYFRIIGKSVKNIHASSIVLQACASTICSLSGIWADIAVASHVGCIALDLMKLKELLTQKNQRLLVVCTVI